MARQNDFQWKTVTAFKPTRKGDQWEYQARGWLDGFGWLNVNWTANKGKSNFVHVDRLIRAKLLARQEAMSAGSEEVLQHFYTFEFSTIQEDDISE